MRSLVTLVAVLSSTTVFAQSHICKDVLVNGTKATAEWRSDVFLSQILEIESSDRTDQQNQESIETGGNYGIIGGYGNRNDRDRFLREIRKSLNFESILRDKSSSMLSSGDETIVNAWRDCMTRAYGLSLRFETKTPESANLIVEWYAYPTAPDVEKETKIKADVVLPPHVQVSDPNGCLKAETVLQPGQTCTAQVSAAPDKEISAVISTQHGEATAFLPPRLKIVEERLAIEAVITEGKNKGKPLEAGKYAFDDYAESQLMCWSAPGDWQLLEGSLTFPTRVDGPMSRSRCKPKDVTISAGKRVCWRAFNQTNVKGDNYCYVGLAGELVRWRIAPGL